MADKSYQFGPVLTDRIISVVKRVDGTPYEVGLTRIPTRFEDSPAYSPGLSRGTFTGSWAIDATNVVTIEGTTQTAEVTNYCVPVEADTASTQSFNVIFGSVMGTMTVVEIQHQQPTNTCTLVIGGIDLRELPDYDATVIQLLGHGEFSEGSSECGLKWFSVTACSTATAT